MLTKHYYSVISVMVHIVIKKKCIESSVI